MQNQVCVVKSKWKNKNKNNGMLHSSMVTLIEKEEEPQRPCYEAKIEQSIYKCMLYSDFNS